MWLAPVFAPGAEQEWYESYQQGVRALSEGRAREAVRWLKQAARKRPTPGTNLRTYGTNVESEYYPYLRLAEAYLALGDTEASREALEVSLGLGGEPAREREAILTRIVALEESRRPRPTATPEAQPEPSPPPTPSPTPPPAATGTPSPTATAPATPAPAPLLRATPRPVAPPSVAEPSPVQPAPQAILEIVSAPPGALVYIDDEMVGATDPESGRLVRRGLSPGPHRLRLSLAGRSDARHDVTVEAGRHAAVHVALAEPELRHEALPSSTALLALVVLTALAVSAWGLRLLLRPAMGREPGPGSGVTPVRPETPGRAERSTPTPEALPQKFGAYVLLERLGRGGMAAVYKAERRGELVALKRPLASVAEDPLFLERFLREAAIGRALYHPNIVRILEEGEVEGSPYFTMELIAGETLQARLRRAGPFSPQAAVRLVTGVAEALDYAHNKGVVHRDLKPSNIMLLPDGTPKVADYGIARAQRFEGLTVTGSFLGSPDYVSPESIEGRPNDPRSDLYSLGVVFYEVLVGERPFAADTPFGVLQCHLREAPRPPSQVGPAVPPELDAVVLRLLAKRADDRYPSAESLLLSLTEYLNRTA